MDALESDAIAATNSPASKAKRLPRIQRDILSLKKPTSQLLAAAKNVHRSSMGAESSKFEVREYVHEANEFCARCACTQCVGYRETMTVMVQDQMISTDLWRTVQNILQTCYGNILKGCSSTVCDIYQQLIGDTKFGWQSTGHVNRTKREHLDYIASVPDEVTKFVFCSTLLLADDSHQLLELLSYEVECFARAYARGIYDKRQADMTSEDKINYILNGYEKLCKLSEKVGSLLFTLESDHFSKFNLTWTLLNKRMYQQFVFKKFTETAVQCMLKLKSEVSTNKYIEILRKYIEFDDKMLVVRDEWKGTWEAINRYHMTNEDIDRRERIRLTHSIFESTQEIPSEDLDNVVNPIEWDCCEDRGAVWRNVVTTVKNSWQKWDRSRLHAPVHLEKCVSCKTWTDNHKVSCKCVTCSIGGPFYSSANENLIKSMCYKCAFMQNAIQESTASSTFINNLKKALKEEYGKGISSKVTNQPADKDYHLCWAVFKQIPGRLKYTSQTLAANNFCNSCNRLECAIARSVVNREIDASFSKVAMHCYRPLRLSHEENEATISSVKMYLEQIRNSADAKCYSDDDVILNTFFAFCVSIFLRQFVDGMARSDQLCVENLKICNEAVELNDQQTGDDSKDVMERIVMSIRIPPEDVTSQSTLEEVTMEGNEANAQNSTTDLENAISGIRLSDQDPAQTPTNPTQRKKLSKPNKLTANISNQYSTVVVASESEKQSIETDRKTIRDDSSDKRTNSNDSKKSKDTLNNKKSVDKWIKETLSFIEGDEKEKCANKKAEKKNRQKLKKEERKRVDELHNLKAQYQDIYFKEFASKQELKNYKSAKKKDKKKILELENNIKKLNVAKSKIEKTILESLAIVKSINPNFKLSYLPSREELELAMQKDACADEVNQNEAVSITNVESSMANLRLTMPPGMMPYRAAEPLMRPPPQMSTEFLTDPSKRIVTIRRVNLPNLAEPQVTVTAKGVSPQDDKLLYTFINGQIVPASSLDRQMLNVLSTQNAPFGRNDLQPSIQEQAARYGNTVFASPFAQEQMYAQSNNVPVKSQPSDRNVKTATAKTNDRKPKPSSSNDSKKKEPSRKDCNNGSDDRSTATDQTEASTEPKKKQKRKKKKRQTEECSITPIDTNQANVSLCRAYAETNTNSICDSMRNMNINPNATSEPRQSETRPNSSYVQLNVSIMDQINKGIQVENLTLPPGITLTKVDPVKAELMRAKRQTIEKISQRMPETPPNPMNVLPNHLDLRIIDHQQNIITACPKSEPVVSNSHTNNNSSIPTQSKKKGKKNKKNKNAKGKQETGAQPNIVTLRNPMFQQANNSHGGGGGMVNNSMPMRPLPMDTPAAIIKNENGMFTIRNPALHHAAQAAPSGMAPSYPYLYISNNKDANQQATGYHQPERGNFQNDTSSCMKNQKSEFKMYSYMNEPSRFVINSDNATSCSDDNDQCDRMHMLRNLKPGQRLNSEVTIHNVNERNSEKFITQADCLEIRPTSKMCSN